ncbi:MAG: L,D-transpeptidase family protein [Ferruginibacter sp.]
MYYRKPQLIVLAVILLLAACHHRNSDKKEEIIVNPESMDAHVTDNIKQLLSTAEDNDGKLDDSLHLSFLPVIKYYYQQNDAAPVWSHSEKWNGAADSFLLYLKDAAYNGLYKSDYNYDKLASLHETMLADSIKRRDAVLWAKSELLFTSAFMHVVEDLKQGRLQPDSMTLKNDEKNYKNYFVSNLDKLKDGQQISIIFDSLQPAIEDYQSLKKGIKKFVDSMDTKIYTYLNYPAKDSSAFVKKLQKRLSESGIATTTSIDTAQLKAAIKKYQEKKGIKADGKLSTSLVKLLNLTDREKFNRIAITLDRYKQMPEKMPRQYILVNLPAFYLKVMDADTIALESKIICGKPATPTPFITSAITDIIIYPTWTIPASIVKKDIIPGMKKNPGYLARKGFHLINNKGETVDPSMVNWSKYTKGIPYNVMQGSGDDNALGVIKFNFSNPYSVYLHDTNQRYLFKNGMRSLSHGCVRVQEWQKLAFYLVRNDSMLAKQPELLHYNSDSISQWISLKEKHRIDVKNRFPLFIRYFGCELVNGKIKFYDDIYNDDKAMREKYLAGK